MINIKFVLFFSFVFFFISKPSQAQEEKEIDIPNHIVDVFWGSDTIKMAEYIKSGEYPFGYKPKYKVSPIEIAVRKNRIGVIKYLIDGAGLPVTNSYISDIVCDHGINLDTFNSLLSFASHKAKIDVYQWPNYDEKGISAFYERMRLLVLYGFDFINITDSEERTKFYVSVIENEDWALCDLLDYTDEAFNGHTCYGHTVMTTAVRTKSYDLVKFLLDKGLDKNVRIFEACYDDAQEQESPYDIAAYWKLVDIMELLEKY